MMIKMKMHYLMVLLLIGKLVWLNSGSGLVSKVFQVWVQERESKVSYSDGLDTNMKKWNLNSFGTIVIRLKHKFANTVRFINSKVSKRSWFFCFFICHHSISYIPKDLVIWRFWTYRITVTSLAPDTFKVGINVGNYLNLSTKVDLISHDNQNE